MEDDLKGKMFHVKDFQVKYQPMGERDNPEAPTNHFVTLQLLSEVGKSDNIMRSPLMFLNPKIAKELGQRLLREAKAAMESSSGAADSPKKRH